MFGSIVGDDLLRKGWSLRCLREAKAELIIAREESDIASSINRSILAMRKAQSAIYYCLGDPSYLGPMIARIASGQEPAGRDELLNFLVKLEKMIQFTLELNPPSKNEVLRSAEKFVNIAEDFIKTSIPEVE